MQQLLCDIRNKLLTIMQGQPDLIQSKLFKKKSLFLTVSVLKKFDSRDKAFHKMEMEEKKVRNYFGNIVFNLLVSHCV